MPLHEACIFLHLGVHNGSVLVLRRVWTLARECVAVLVSVHPQHSFRLKKFQKGINCAGQCALFSGQPSDMISHRACRVLSFDVSMRISTIRIGLAFRCMCRPTSCTDRSRPRIGPVLHGFTLASASASLTSLPGTYLI